MAFTRITQGELNSRGCTTLPNQPAISAQELKEEFDAPAKEVVAPKVNNLMNELEATTAAASLGAVAPTGFSGETIQLILNALGSAVKTIEASQVGATAPSGQTGSDVQALINSISETITELQGLAHSHSNKALLDTYEQTETDLADAVAKKHTHSNKSTLDKLSEDSSGNPTFNGNVIPTSGSLGGFQKYIDADILQPTGSGTEGDIKIYETTGGTKIMYRYSSGSWSRMYDNYIHVGSSNVPFDCFDVSDVDYGAGQPLDAGKIVLVYE